MELKSTEVIEIVSELIEFVDKKFENNEKTIKGATNLKYKIYANAKNEYRYKNFLLKGFVGQGRLKICDVGIAFLYGKNKINDGFYICFVYNYRKKEIYLELGSSYENISKLSENKKSEFNKKSTKKISRINLNYSDLIIKIDDILKEFLQFYK
ncbi:hypothetical protein [Fusobacterium sp.]|uniref:hypothetical protein n=1 Tax=Fusobacterium sp. TaxID=68766 RepID=UPI00290367F7|nr:hypothetical protein [Fusobacterium sp.]MDU1911930.1 hypothetical protein [Fusobacterium sp.]